MKKFSINKLCLSHLFKLPLQRLICYLVLVRGGLDGVYERLTTDALTNGLVLQLFLSIIDTENCY